MIHTSCPEQNRISEYLRGILPEDESGGIAEHLEHCTKCDGVAEQLEQADRESDWLIRHLGMTTEIMQSNEHALDAALDYVQRSNDPAGSAELAIADASDEQLLSIGNYHIEQIVGRGGMGIVCRATHEKLNKTVALKIISTTHLSDAHNRFQREMRAIGGLQHDAIVQATDAGCVDGRPFLAMHFVEGIDLAALLQMHGPLSIENACEIARQAANGLQFAHDQNIVHRDIKPSNIMLDADGRVKILDFGLAQMQTASASVTMATSVGQLLGTLDYLAPEQTDGSNVDARADVYSLAATLYALLTGRPPLGGSADKPVLHHLRKLVSEKPQPIDEIRDDAPLELTNLLQRALETEPDRRNLSARQFADALQRHCEHADLSELVPEPARLTQDSAVEHRKEAIHCLRKLYDPNSLFQNSMPIPAETKTLSGPKSARSATGRFIRYAAGLLIALALIGGGGCLGIVLYLETGDGRLKIQSDAEDVHVTVLKNDEVVDEIEVSRGEKEITIRAGKYEVRVESESDEVEISQDSVRVFRDDEAVLVVTKVPQEEFAEREKANSSTKIRTAGNLAAESSLETRLAALEKPPLWQNRRPEEWLVVLRQERDEATRVDAVDAIIGISEDLPPDLAAGVLLECGSATLDAYVNNDPNKVPDVVIARRNFWAGETFRGSGAVCQFVNDEMLKSAELLAKKASWVSGALGKLSIETLRAQIEPTMGGDNHAAKAMLLRVLVGIAFSTEESDQLTADLLIEHGGESGMTSQVARAIAASMMHNEDGVALLQRELEGPVENSNHAALLLRLARRFYPEKISDDVLLDVLARTCAQSDYDTAMRLHGTQQLWPPSESATQSHTRTGDAFAAVLLPPLEEKLKLEDFGRRFINSEQDPQLLVHFTLLVRVLTDHSASPKHTDRAAAFLERAIGRIVTARNDFELKPSSWALVDVVQNSGANFRNAVELYVCLTGLLPESLKKPVEGNGDLVESLRYYETHMAGKIESNSGRDGDWLAEKWFPHHSIRAAVDGLERSPDGDSTLKLQMRYSHMSLSAATVFASVLELQGTSEITDELLIQLIVSPAREPNPADLSKLRYSIRAEMDVCDSHLLSDYWFRIKQHPKLIELALRMIEEAKSDRLKACALAIFCVNNSDTFAETIKQYSLADPLWKLMLSEDNVASLYAILWVEQAGLLKGNMRIEEVVQRLSRDGFDMSRSSNMIESFLNQRLHLLGRFDDATLKSVSATMIQSIMAAESDSYPRPSVVDVRGAVESDHALIQLAEICARFPGEGKKFRAELEELTAAVSGKSSKTHTRHHKQRFSDAITKLLE